VGSWCTQSDSPDITATTPDAGLWASRVGGRFCLPESVAGRFAELFEVPEAENYSIDDLVRR
jgi:hypothetical protein